MENIAKGYVFGNYRILGNLGAGGMGEVYLAEDIQLDRKVAIKIISKDQDEKAKKRFHNEAKVLAALKHPNIVGIYNYGTHEDSGFIAMEYVQGSNLSEVIQSRQFDLGESIKVLKKLSEAIAEAHSHGVLHRDLKPSNVVIDNNGEVKLVDFGISKDLASDDLKLTKTDHFIGSVLYMAPELLRGQKANVKTDLFSLGVILYEMLVGHNPSIGTNKFEVMEKVKTSQIELPEEVLPLIPEKLKIIFDKLVAHDVNERFESALQVSEALDQITKEDIPEEFLLARRPEVNISNESSLRMQLMSKGFKTREVGIIISIAAQIQEDQTFEGDKTVAVDRSDKLVVSNSSLQKAVLKYLNSKSRLKSAENSGTGKIAKTLAEKIHLPEDAGQKSLYAAVGAVAIGVVALLYSLISGPSGTNTLQPPFVGAKYVERVRIINADTGELVKDSKHHLEITDYKDGIKHLQWTVEGVEGLYKLEVSPNPFVWHSKFIPPKGAPEVAVINGNPNKIFPLEIGKKMNYEVVTNTPNGEAFSTKAACEVLGQEVLTIAAGTFDTFVVECKTTGDNTFVQTYYYSPKTRGYVKREQRYQKAKWMQVTVNEIVSYDIP